MSRRAACIVLVLWSAGADALAIVIGVADDVATGGLLAGRDAACVYFVTNLRAPGQLSLLARAP